MAASNSPFVGYRRRQAGAPSTRAVANFPGMINADEIHRAKLLPLDEQYGDVYSAVYPTDGTFPAEHIIADLAAAVFGYEQIHINAASFGALLACDLIDELRRLGYTGKVSGNLIHPCVRTGLRLLPWRFFTKPTLEDGVAGSQNLLDHRAYMASQTLKNSFWSQFRYVLSHRAPRVGAYHDIDMLVIAPGRYDPLLHRRSARPFILAFNAVDLPIASIGHCDFVEQPSIWRGIFSFLYGMHYPNG